MMATSRSRMTRMNESYKCHGVNSRFFNFSGGLRLWRRILTTENTESCCFLCVLCALCGFLIPFQKIIESLVNSCHSQIREICVKNVSEYTIEIQSVSRMTRLNESYEFNYVSMPEAMS